MAQPLKICAQCLAFLRESEEGQQDLAAYLMGTGAGGVEIVPAGACQARLTGHTETTCPPPPEGKDLADITPEELDRAIALFVKQLQLPSGSSGGLWDLECAIKSEWLKAMEIRERKTRGAPEDNPWL